MHNTKVDKIYERLADLVASRHSDSPDEALEEQISISNLFKITSPFIHKACPRGCEGECWNYFE